MKAFRIITSLCLSLSAAGVHAQTFGIDWSTTQGGSPASGGGFTINDSIGQANASPPMSGGPFALHGGYWNGAFLRPELRVTRAGASLVIAWPHSATGFHLQSASALLGAATVWTDVPILPVTVASEEQVTLGINGDRQFFRLRQL